jgi:energy-coupling factor transporter ATP-binding protein EcfA2
MNIVSLKIKNFLSIADVEIKPGQINQIVGQNNQGKTTVIKAIQFAAKGGTDPNLVKFGTEAAEVVIELDDQTVIRRRLSAEGKQSVDIKKDGFKAPTPQAYLDALFEDSGFNPLDLLDPKKRNDAILASIPIKVDEARLQSELNDSPYIKTPMPPLDYTLHGLKVIDHCHRYFYQRRAEANKDASDKKKRWETYQADLPKEDSGPLTRAQVQTELDAAKSAHDQAVSALALVTQRHEDARRAQDRLNKYCKTIDEIDAEIAKLQARREEGMKFVDQAKKEVPEALEDQRPHAQKCEDLLIEVERVKGRFAEVEKFESVGKQRAMVANMKQEWEGAQKVADGLTDRVEKLSGPLKAKLMGEAEMPITGLEYKEGGFLVDGTPVDNLSSSKALKLAVGVARKLSKKTKLICIDGAELLDTDSYKTLIEEINGDGFTYFITRVGAVNHPDHKVFEMKEGAVR